MFCMKGAERFIVGNKIRYVIARNFPSISPIIPCYRRRKGREIWTGRKGERAERQGRQEGRRREEATHDGLTDKWLASRTAFILSYTLGGGDGSLMLLHVRMTIRGLCTL